MKVSTGINGFGRFGQHLLKYWIEQKHKTFRIDYINDAHLSLEKSWDLITTDRYLGTFFREHLSRTNQGFSVQLPDGENHEIIYSQQQDTEISWIGKPIIFLECTGRNTDAEKCQQFLQDNTTHVLISATSLNADALLVYGFNAQDLKPEWQTISYGSCTVNAFVPLAHFIDQAYGINDCDVTVIHNVPEYQLEDTLIRKECTLETVAPRLLSFTTPNNFTVNYTLIPYTGVSMIDFRFNVKQTPNKEELLHSLKETSKIGRLQGLYKIVDTDQGPHPHKFTKYSAVLVASTTKIVGNNIYIHAYFDNENSVNRFFDMTQHIIEAAYGR